MVLEITLPGHEPDDALNDMLGLRVVDQGVTPGGRKIKLGKRRRTLRGGFEYVSLANPELMAVAVVRSRKARENRARNERATQ